MLVSFQVTDVVYGFIIIFAEFYQAIFQYKCCLSFLFLTIEANHINIHVKNEGQKEKEADI